MILDRLIPPDGLEPVALGSEDYQGRAPDCEIAVIDPETAAEVLGPRFTIVSGDGALALHELGLR